MEQLSVSDEFIFKSIVENSPFPIGIYAGQELKILFANQAMLTSWGKGTDVLGKLYTAVHPELKNQKIIEQLRGVLESGIPCQSTDTRVELVIDGTLTTRYFNYSLTPLFNQEGNAYAVMSTGVEVTDLNQARQHVTDTEEKLRLAMESAELGTYVTDLITDEVTTSGKFDLIWDVKGKMTRNDFIQQLHPEDLPLRAEAHQLAAVSGKLSYEARIIRTDDSIRWVKINGKITYNEQGIPAMLIGVVQDITEHKQFADHLSQMVEQRTKDLKRSNEDLVQFAHVVSHDLKEPVRKIKMFNDALKNILTDKVDEKGLKYLEKMQTASDRIFLIIDDVLAYSTINASGYPPQKIDLNDIIHHIKSDLELLIDEKKAILIMDELPVIEGAAVLIHQLFYNLINNALKFSKAERPPRVTISSAIIDVNAEPHVRVTVADNGIGIDAQYSARIFEAFERLHSKNDYEGTGLGLSLCRKIAERHNGTIEVTSQLDEGSDFIVCLPLTQKNKTI
jgi:PAS domain S-box-containing protein